MLHTAYSPVHALAGGVLIGLASLLAMVATGQVPGISGLFSRVLRPRSGEWAWRAVFFVGLLVGAAMGTLPDLDVLPMAIAGAVGGYLVIHYILNKKPDADNSFEFEQKDPSDNP